MSDLISRQAAIDLLNDGAELLRSALLDETDILWDDRAKYEWGLGLIEAYIFDMNDLPPAQPEHGRWIPLNNQTAKCSLCGATESTFGKDLTGRALIHKAVKRYCSWCGNPLDEVEEK